MDLKSKLIASFEDEPASPSSGGIAHDVPSLIDLNDASERERVRRGTDWEDQKERVRQLVLGRLGPRLSDVDDSARRDVVREAVAQALEDNEVTVSPREQRAFVDEVMSDLLGYGPLDPLLADPKITEIMCNGYDRIWVEQSGMIEETTLSFASPEHYRRVIDRMVREVGRRIDESSPMVDARMRDGGRLNAVIPPLALDGPALTIRKAPPDPLTVSDMLSMGNWTPEVARFLEACVIARASVLVSGGTGAGKTTVLGVLTRFIPDTERVVTIEDAAELHCHQPNHVRLEARPANAEQAGLVTIRDLVRNALRMRPDRIVIGECRGGEALDMLQAMNTGHDGSITTLHANSARDALSRLETLVLLAGVDLPLRAIREQIASAIDLVVHLDRLPNGRRLVSSISEVQGLEAEAFSMAEIFRADPIDGRLVPTGVRPALHSRLAPEVAPPVSIYRADG